MATDTIDGSRRRGRTRPRGPATLTWRAGFPRGRCSTPKSIYKTPEGEAEIRTLYEEALTGLGLGHESLTVETRFGDTHVLALGPADAPPAVFLPGGNFLNPIVLEWFLPLAERHRLYASDVVGQPGKSAQERPSPKGDGHAFWVEDVLDGLGLARAARGDLLRGGHSHQDHGSGPRARLQGGARRPLRHSRGPRFADARRSRRHLASLPPEAHARAPVARGPY